MQQTNVKNNEVSLTPFIEDKSINWDVVGNGISRKIMSYEERVMMVKVAFEKGAIGTLHSHPHIQLTFVQSGVFEVEINQEKKVLRQGDVFHVPSGIIHGVVCLKDGELIDVFSPFREDFVTV